jgi:hypothetical protein
VNRAAVGAGFVNGASRDSNRCDPAADAGSAGLGSLSVESKLKPIEIITACEASRISIGEWS